MKTPSLLCIAFLCTGPVVAQDAPQVCADGNCIQIGSFNIELLGKTRKEFDGVERHFRNDEQLLAISDLVAKTLDLELIVFQEINTESSQWATLKSNLEVQGYRFFEGTSSARKQFVVLAWDSDEVSLVDQSAHEMDVQTTFGNPGEERYYKGARKPVAGRFKAGQFDFWLVGVHLKSRSGSGDWPATIRTKQGKQLIEKIDAIVEDSGEKDVIITGDFNQLLGHESLKPFVDGGFTSQMKFRMGGSGKGSYIKTGDLHESNDLIDHVMLRFGETQEVVRNSGFVLKLSSTDKAKNYIVKTSDHVPVWASFRIDEDLDGTN